MTVAFESVDCFNKRGWCSEEGTVWPVTLVIALEEDCSHIREVEIEAHAFKLPTVVRVSTERQCSGPMLHFSSNLTEHFASSVRKAAKVNLRGHRCILHIDGPQSNKHNLFHEVHLLRVTLELAATNAIENQSESLEYKVDLGGDGMDQPLRTYEVLTPNKTVDGFHHGYLSEVDDALLYAGLPVKLVAETAVSTRVDHEIGCTVRHLESSKVVAEQKEAYESAGNLNRTIKELLSLGMAAARLMEEKREAVVDEDYDQAARLLVSIEARRQEAQACVRRNLGGEILRDLQLREYPQDAAATAPSRQPQFEPTISNVPYIKEIRTETVQCPNLELPHAENAATVMPTRSARASLESLPSPVRTGRGSSLTSSRDLEEKNEEGKNQDAEDQGKVPPATESRPSSPSPRNTSSRGLLRVFSRPSSAKSTPRSHTQPEQQTNSSPNPSEGGVPEVDITRAPSSGRSQHSASIPSPKSTTSPETLTTSFPEEKDAEVTSIERLANDHTGPPVITQEIEETKDDLFEQEQDLSNQLAPSPKPKREVVLPDSSLAQGHTTGKKETTPSEDVNSYRTMLNQIDNLAADGKTDTSLNSARTADTAAKQDASGADASKSGKDKGKSSACHVQ